MKHIIDQVSWQEVCNGIMCSECSMLEKGACRIEEYIKKLPEAEKPHGECKTCKHYVPYRDQFSNRPRGDGYCNSNITTLDGNAFINCHDEWYCANYEKEGGEK